MHERTTDSKRGDRVHFLRLFQDQCGRSEAILDFTDSMKVTLKGDRVQAFDATCDETLISMKKIPDEEILENMYKLQLKNWEELKSMMTLYTQDTVCKSKLSQTDGSKALGSED